MSSLMIMPSLMNMPSCPIFEFFPSIFIIFLFVSTIHDLIIDQDITFSRALLREGLIGVYIFRLQCIRIEFNEHDKFNEHAKLSNFFLQSSESFYS